MNFTKEQLNKIHIEGLTNTTIPTYKGGSKMHKVPHPSQRPQPSKPYIHPVKNLPKVETSTSTDKNIKKEEEDDDESTDSVKSTGSKSVTNKFVKRVEEYVATDNDIREKESNLKQLKDSKKSSEEYIIQYLDAVGESTIDIANGKLRKNACETKGPLKQDTIKEAIELEVTKSFDKLIKQVSDILEKDPSKDEVNKYLQTLKDVKTKFNIKDTATQTMVRMDELRDMKKRVNLKRTFVRDKKEEKPKEKPAKKKA